MDATNRHVTVATAREAVRLYKFLRRPTNLALVPIELAHIHSTLPANFPITPCESCSSSLLLNTCQVPLLWKSPAVGLKHQLKSSLPTRLVFFRNLLSHEFLPLPEVVMLQACNRISVLHPSRGEHGDTSSRSWCTCIFIPTRLLPLPLQSHLCSLDLLPCDPCLSLALDCLQPQVPSLQNCPRPAARSHSAYKPPLPSGNSPNTSV